MINSSNYDGHYTGNRERHKISLPSRVEQWYYKHGLFLSSYPTCASSIAIVAILFCCYPLLYIPLPGTIPTKVILPYSSANLNRADSTLNVGDLFGNHHPNTSIVSNFFNLNNFTFEPPFPWARTEPFVYVQQIVLRSSVTPWNDNLVLTDAFRAPLYEVFKLLEIIRNHEVEESKTTLGNICLHVENVKTSAKETVFPEYNCLILSPANFWHQNSQSFNKDTGLLNTIFQFHNLQKTKVSTAEMLFGITIRDTGIKRYPIRARPRIVQFAITLILRENHTKFLNSLKEKLTKMYSLHQTTDNKPMHRESLMYIYYPGEFNFVEILPLCIAFILLFFYVYFFFRKMDLIRSRVILAFSAVITVLGSLTMSLGLCFFFGLTISMQSKGIFPYLVILVGLENVLVITKCVISTDEKLDVKIRVAKGLSKEGWSISKTLLTEITILTVGLATFVPVIQEFCIFAIVGLISDYFLQMLLFSTVLAMDIKPFEHSVNMKQSMKNFGETYSQNHLKYSSSSHATMNRSQSHPKLNALMLDKNTPTDVIATGAINVDKKIPKRLRFGYFWARTRFFQRCFMGWMILWIASIVYNSGVIENFFLFDGKSSSSSSLESDTHATDNLSPDNDIDISNESKYELFNIASSTKMPFYHQSTVISGQPPDEVFVNLTEQLNKLKYPEYDTNNHLSNFHWSSILRQYNISVSGKYVAILPPIKLSHAIAPETAINLRNPEEKSPQHFQWKALAVALDPIDFSDMENLESPNHHHGTGNVPLYPKSPMEIFLTAILCCISVSVLTYTLIVMYRCICTRNYAEWRASWNDTDPIHPKTERVLQSSVPISVKGHTHRIECLVTDGFMVASSCLEGQIKIFDANTGEQIAKIDRQNYFKEQNRNKPHSSSQQYHQQHYQQHNYHHYPNHQQEIENKLHISQASSSPSIQLNDTKYPRNFMTSHSFDDSIGRGSPSPPKQHHSQFVSPIWCLDFLDNLIAVGCADGRLEFWEGSTGNLKCVLDGENTYRNGVTNIKLTGDRVVVTRLCGRVDFLRLETYSQGKQIDWGFTSAYRRTHIRTGSTGSLALLHQQNQGTMAGTNSGEELRCIIEFKHQGHQQPITCLEVVRGTIFTGSQDHTLKVFKLDNLSLQYTLHGHCGPITCLFIDHSQPGTGGSGSQDGLLCLWDLSSGACMYGIQAHDGAVVSIVCSPSYIISLGSDERLCIWERFQGHLLNSINAPYAYSSLLMLTPSLLLTSKPGSLIVWDVRSGEPTREVKLDCANSQLCPKMILPACDCVICDYGNELRIVRFPLVAEKID